MSTDDLTDPETTLVGTLIAGKYRVDRILGAGGMGLVVQATHVALNQPVALKLIRDHVRRSPEMFARFMREAKAAAKLPPAHIARVTDIGQSDRGEPFLVMELLVGRDLRSELQVRGRLPIEEAVQYILQASEGIAEAHAAGLVHRDLKPANLFLDMRGVAGPVIKVLDFGLSKSYDPKLDQLTTTHSTFGTPGYTSPEQIRSAKYAEPRSDQHALAMILFELLTGRMAFIAENVTELLVHIFTLAPPHARELRPDVPKALDAALVRAMAKEPEQRFLDLAGFAAAIAPFGGAEGAAAAERIARILDPESVSSFAPKPSSPGMAARLTPTPEADTNAPTISEPALSAAAYRKKPPLVALAVAGVLVISVAIVVFTAGGAGSPEPSAPSVPAMTAEAPPASPPSADLPAVAPSEAALVSPSASAVPAPPPTAQPTSSKASTSRPSGSAPRVPASKTGKTRTIKPRKETARDVFGGDR